uniref:Uncharacterized protein n=1 Tax=Arundo donax TaxID=35708 RepID=A0A0A9A366_ARUDO
MSNTVLTSQYVPNVLFKSGCPAGYVHVVNFAKYIPCCAASNNFLYIEV